MRRKYGKRKFKEAKDQLASSFSDFIPGLDDFIICNDCEVLMIQVKEKLDKCQAREERIQLLTLIPEYWSRERAVSFFDVTESWLELQEVSKKGERYPGDTKFNP